MSEPMLVNLSDAILSIVKDSDDAGTVTAQQGSALIQINQKVTKFSQRWRESTRSLEAEIVDAASKVGKGDD